MYIDRKITIWERMKFRDEEEFKQAIQILKDTNNISEVDNQNFEIEYEPLFDTTEEMTVEENGGSSTVEAFNNTELIYQNGNS